MGNVFLHGKGGGGGGLAFRVIGGTSAPSNPKPNDIWVNTNVEITSYIFSATEPKGSAQGMVWITTGTSSSVAFNALKKNGLQVYPISAKQYVDGAWVDKTAKSYQNGKWVDWIVVVYEPGKTGVFAAQAWKAVSSAAAVSPTITHGTANVSISISGNNGGGTGVAYCGPYDLSQHSKIKFTGSVSGSANGYQEGVYVVKTIGSGYYHTDNAARKSIPASGSFDDYVDISGVTGQCYICVGIRNHGNTRTITLTNMKLT